MDRINVGRLSFRRKGSHKKDKHKNNETSSEGSKVNTPEVKYIRYTVVSFILNFFFKL